MMVSLCCLLVSLCMTTVDTTAADYRIASGDLRSVIKTCANLPETLTQDIEVTLNDREFQVVARNAVILLFALSSVSDTAIDNEQDTSELSESLIHLCYSAFLPDSLIAQIKKQVIPLFEEVCGKLRDKPPGTNFGKTWSFDSGQSVRLILPRERWFELEQYTCVADGLTPKEASDLRTRTTLAPERADFRDRWHFKEATTFTRIAKQKFREDGLLLPYGHPRIGFEHPNP
jgi:hypothetical protein